MSRMKHKPSPEAFRTILETYAHLQAGLATQILQTIDDVGIPTKEWSGWLDEYNLFKGDFINRLTELAVQYKDAPRTEPNLLQVDPDEQRNESNPLL